MARKKHIQPGEKLGLKLTAAQRSLLLDQLLLIPEEVERALRSTPASEPLMLNLDELDDLAGHVAAAANHADTRALGDKLDRISRKIGKLLDTHTDLPPEEREAPSRFAIDLIESLSGKEPVILPMPKARKGEERFPVTLTEKQREALIHATRLRRGLKDRIGQVPPGNQAIAFTPKELGDLAEEVDTSLAFAPSPYKKRLVAVLEKLDDLLDALGPAEDEPIESGREPAEPSDRIYQLKITLKDIRPPIWRRVQVPDCTLGDLHEVIQVAMGWTDSHLHQFVVKGEYYGPTTDEFGFGMDMDVEDEDDLLLSQIGKGGKKVRFTYEYDFGDGWQHEIRLERVVGREPKVTYPRCVAGARACPPEDVGGPWGYAEFLEAMADPEHERHEELREWVGGRFDSEKFSVDAVNKELKRAFR